MCGGWAAPRFVRSDGVPVAWCERCSLWYVCCAVDEADLAELYSRYWEEYRPRVTEEGRGRPDGAKDRRLRRLRALLGGMERPKLLDIGCGYGEFLEMGRAEGFEVRGQELSEAASDYVEKRLGIPMFRGPFGSERFLEGGGPVDAVTMNDVIEHPVDPLGLIREAAAVLRSGGLLLFVTPNGGQAERADWTGFGVDLEHLQYFSGASFARVAELEGMKVEHIESYGYPAYGPAGPGAGSEAPGWKARIRGVAQRNRWAHAAWGMASRMKRRRPADDAAGSYHLLAILRKAR